MKYWAITLSSTAAIGGTWAAATAQVTWQAETAVVRVDRQQNPPKVMIDQAREPARFWREGGAAIVAPERWTVEHLPCLWQVCLDAAEARQSDLGPDVAYPDAAYSEASDRPFDFHQGMVLSSWSREHRYPARAIDSVLNLGQRRVSVTWGSIQPSTGLEHTGSSGIEPMGGGFDDDFKTLLPRLAPADDVDTGWVALFTPPQLATSSDIQRLQLSAYPWLADPLLAHDQTTQELLRLVSSSLSPSLRQALLDALIYLPIVGVVVFALWNYTLREEVKQRIQTENRLQTLTNNTPGVIFQYLLRSNGTEALLYVSSRGAEVWGLSAESAIAEVSQWWQQVHPDDVQPLRHALLRSARTLTLWAAEWRICPTATEEKWLQVSAQPQSQASGDIVWDGLIFDITERKTAEIALRQSEARFQRLASNIPGILYGYRLSPDGTDEFTYLSSGFTAFYGLRPEPALADSQVVWNMTHPDDQEKLRRSVAESYRTLQVWQAQYRVVLPTGQIKWLQGISRPEQQPNGDVVWDGLIIDITERMQIEAALHQSEQRFRNTAANLPGAIFQYVLHVGGTDAVTYMSAGCYDIWEVTAEAIQQNHQILRNLVHPDDAKAFVSSLEQSAQTLEPWSWQWRIITASGQTKWLAAAGRPELKTNGDIVWDSLVMDISDRKQAEIALQTSESRLNTLISNLPGFVYRVANHPDYPVQFISQGVSEITAYTVADYLENRITLGEQVHRYDHARVWNQVQQALQAQVPYECEYRIVTRTGAIKWVWERGQGIWDDSGQLHHLEGFITDISDRKQVELALQESEVRYRQVVEAQTDFILRLLPDTTITFANDAFCEALGLSPQQVIGRPWIELAQPNDLERQAFQQLAHLTPKHPRCFIENRDIRAGGTIGWTQWLNEGVFDDIGQLVEIQSVGRDITNLKQTEAALRRSEERLRLVTENMGDLVCLHSLVGHFTYVTPSSQTLLGLAPAELMGEHPKRLIHPDDYDLVRREMYAPALQGKSGRAIYRMRHQTAGDIWLETLSQPVFDATGVVTQVQTTSRDVSDRIQMEQQLKHDALHDSLTTLPNRDRLMRRLELALNRSKQHPDFQFAVLFLDLDNFKVVNDSLGHLVGDELLISVSQQLVQFMRDTDIAARLGGDEFVILLEEIAHIQDAVVIAERILAALRQPFRVAEREVVITTSIGIVSSDAQYERAVDMLRDADLAMYRAKHNGRAQYAIFDPAMHFRVTQRLHLEQDLRKAIKRSELLLYYQPIVALETLQVVGFEALVRWQHPQRGLVSPLEFIAIAEETGLIKSIGQWVLTTACQQLADWQQQHPHKPLKMSVNLSVQQLQPALISQIEAVLAASQIAPATLVLELTESMLAQNIAITQDLLEQAKQLGIRLSIDDFGTGYSSLSYLSRLPVDHLKIDRAFVNPCETDSRNQVIAESIVALSNLLGLGVIAEGVETPEQLVWLKQLGCQEAQGYLFSPPVPAEAAAQLLYHTISV